MSIELLHPILVHFTIAGFTFAVVLDSLGLFTNNKNFHFSAWMLYIFAGIAVLFTGLSGLLAANTVGHNEIIHDIIEIHESLGMSVGVILLILLFWRYKLKGEFPVDKRGLYHGLAIIGLLLMFSGAYFGGELVFTHGVAVKPMEEIINSGHSHGESTEHSTGMDMEHDQNDKDKHHSENDNSESGDHPHNNDQKEHSH